MKGTSKVVVFTLNRFAQRSDSMRSRAARSLLILLVLALSSCANDGSTDQPDSSAVAFVGVNVLAMAETGVVLEDQTVIVQGDRITAIEPRGSVDVSPQTVQISGRGKYLMPGLADMHVHLEYFDDPAIRFASDDGRFAWTNEDYAQFVVGSARFLWRIAMYPFNATETPPWALVRSDGDPASATP